MKKEYRDKFGNFVHEERKKEEETLAICEDILKNSRNEMAVAMRFLQSAFGALKPIISGETGAMGTDGKLLYAAPGWLIEIFMKDRVRLNHMYLHEVLHCLFCHLWSRKDRDQRIWDLAADIAEKDPAFSADSVPISYALKSVYAAIAEREHCMFFAASDYAEPSDADGEHLDAEGHQKLTKQMLNALQPLLCGKEQEK